MMIAGFQVWYISLFYIIGVALLCLHLSHGMDAMFASLGLRNHAYAPAIRRGARALSLILFLGYASIPISVMCGLGRPYLEQATSRAALGLPTASEVK
jgi:succinate dehydrogenase / fumarate reductase cytochrome b subunit